MRQRFAIKTFFIRPQDTSFELISEGGAGDLDNEITCWVNDWLARNDPQEEHDFKVKITKTTNPRRCREVRIKLLPKGRYQKRQKK